MEFSLATTPSIFHLPNSMLIKMLAKRAIRGSMKKYTAVKGASETIPLLATIQNKVPKILKYDSHFLIEWTLIEEL
ncbi:MAG: hypothetical protein HLX52_04640 [Idiomarinaceae bacterium]|uniref:hypothetical protein n=1 Tax=Idiomarina sp. 28-8 TaxID=1260624 RepID=UPI0011A8F82F|nr:hypothetical protein [Idiomarina sp. 28-8]NWO02235.1 hypothetical protein [Idiomarinaceae bacterium]